MNIRETRPRHDKRRLTVAALRPAANKERAFFVRAQSPTTDRLARDVFCVAADVSVQGLTEMLLERGLNAVAVVDPLGRIVGVLSTVAGATSSEVGECPECRRMVADVRSDSRIEASWFLLARAGGLCPVHPKAVRSA